MSPTSGQNQNQKRRTQTPIETLKMSTKQQKPKKKKPSKDDGKPRRYVVYTVLKYHETLLFIVLMYLINDAFILSLKGIEHIQHLLLHQTPKNCRAACPCWVQRTSLHYIRVMEECQSGLSKRTWKEFRFDRIRYNDEMCEWRKKKRIKDLLSLEVKSEDEEKGQWHLSGKGKYIKKNTDIRNHKSRLV